MSKKLVLIDGHSILNRAFFGLPDLTNSEGVHTNAVLGFLNILFKILEEEKPDYLTVAFDVHAPTFRHKMFDGYKGTRKPMADELRQQVPLMKEMLTAMGVTIMEREGFEADDVIGTMARIGEANGLEVRIVSGDRDLLQLATDHTMVRIPKTKKTGTEIENYFAADVKERYLVTPKEFIDVKALMGDTADNIPGVPGIGEKTATNLIATYGSIEEVHAHASEVKPPRASNNIVEFWEQAVMSKTLATIITDADINYQLEDARLNAISDLYTEAAYMMCKRLEFKHLLNRFDVQAPTCQVDEQFKTITSMQEINQLFAKAKNQECAFFIVPSSKKDAKEEKNGQMSIFAIDEKANDFLGLAIAFSEEDIYYFPCGDEVTSQKLMERMKQSEVIRWITPDLKGAIHIMEELQGVISREQQNYVDTTVAAYLLNPLTGAYPYEDIAKNYLGLMIPSKTDILGKKSCEELWEENPEAVAKYACYEAFVAFKAWSALLQELQNTGMEKLYFEIELPLIYVLADMELEGIAINAEELKAYGESLTGSIAELESRIYEAAGENFNINSPKQLGVILFEKMQLPNGKKTKTGYSTSADVLEKLAAEYPIVSDILEYRQLTKLKSTYADGLANYIDEDGRIRSSFNQTITATGRLSSTEPNLQNIPIRIELGKMIRKVFYAKEGYCFLDSDYSQIELRVLASLSGDEQLIDAYKQEKDIHRITASQVFDIPFEEVTPLQRRNAKAVNFGIVYGISSFGLSQDLSISKKEAAAYIERYFETYPKIKGFLDKAVEDAKKQGYTITEFGRRRPIPELASSNFMQRSFGERVAMNAPIQGTAADIIKIAMINVHDRLLKEGLDSRLILQVHDELLIETKEEEKEKVSQILKEEMTGAANLAVTLEIETESGYTWYDAH